MITWDPPNGKLWTIFDSPKGRRWDGIWWSFLGGVCFPTSSDFAENRCHTKPLSCLDPFKAGGFQPRPETIVSPDPSGRKRCRMRVGWCLWGLVDAEWGLVDLLLVRFKIEVPHFFSPSMSPLNPFNFLKSGWLDKNPWRIRYLRWFLAAWCSTSYFDA